MKVTPRKDEVTAIVEVLNSDEFDSAEAMAKAVIKSVAELFAKRDWYAWIWREESDPPFQLGFGPVSSEVEATKLAKNSGLKGRHMALRLGSTAALLERAAEKPASLFCLNTDCNHSLHVHEHPGFGGKCAVKRCQCRRAQK